MKNVIKLTAISSLLIIACLLIGACGSGGSQLVQGKGDFNFTVKDSANNLLSNIQVVVHEDSSTGPLIGNPVTISNGLFYWASPQAGVAHNYLFTFTDLTVPARFAPKTLTETPDILNTQNILVTM